MIVEPPYVPDLVSLVPAGAEIAILARVDLLRGSRVAALVQELGRDDSDWAALRAAGLDPLRDVERVLVAGRERGNEPDVVALEHRWSEPQLLEVYARTVGAPSGALPEVRPAGRFRVVTLPGADVALIVLTEAVAAFSPLEQVPQILERAEAPGTDAGETGQRLRGLDARAPDLAPAAALRMTAARDPERSDWAQEVGQLGLPAPDWFAAVVALDDGATGWVAGGYPSAIEADGAARALRALLTQAFHPAALLLRVMGLGRALESSQVTNGGTEVTLRVHLEPAELDRVVARLGSGGP